MPWHTIITISATCHVNYKPFSSYYVKTHLPRRSVLQYFSWSSLSNYLLLKAVRLHNLCKSYYFLIVFNNSHFSVSRPLLQLRWSLICCGEGLFKGLGLIKPKLLAREATGTSNSVHFKSEETGSQMVSFLRLCAVFYFVLFQIKVFWLNFEECPQAFHLLGKIIDKVSSSSCSN